MSYGVEAAPKDDGVAVTRIETGVIVINLRACMYSNPRTVIVENAPNIFGGNISVYSQLPH